METTSKIRQKQKCLLKKQNRETKRTWNRTHHLNREMNLNKGTLTINSLSFKTPAKQEKCSLNLAERIYRGKATLLSKTIPLRL